eukprot:m.72416 g.72416  ORF g.72416 m.72416 type:complete len:655 (-) comp8382_c1_seq8:1255-3219(-)
MEGTESLAAACVNDVVPLISNFPTNKTVFALTETIKVICTLYKTSTSFFKLVDLLPVFTKLCSQWKENFIGLTTKGFESSDVWDEHMKIIRFVTFKLVEIVRVSASHISYSVPLFVEALVYHSSEFPPCKSYPSQHDSLVRELVNVETLPITLLCRDLSCHPSLYDSLLSSIDGEGKRSDAVLFCLCSSLARGAKIDSPWLMQPSDGDDAASSRVHFVFDAIFRLVSQSFIALNSGIAFKAGKPPQPLLAFNVILSATKALVEFYINKGLFVDIEKILFQYMTHPHPFCQLLVHDLWCFGVSPFVTPEVIANHVLQLCRTSIHLHRVGGHESDADDIIDLARDIVEAYLSVHTNNNNNNKINGIGSGNGDDSKQEGITIDDKDANEEANNELCNEMLKALMEVDEDMGDGLSIWMFIPFTSFALHGCNADDHLTKVLDDLMDVDTVVHGAIPLPFRVRILVHHVRYLRLTATQHLVTICTPLLQILKNGQAHDLNVIGDSILLCIEILKAFEATNAFDPFGAYGGMLLDALTTCFEQLDASPVTTYCAHVATILNEVPTIPWTEDMLNKFSRFLGVVFEVVEQGTLEDGVLLEAFRQFVAHVHSVEYVKTLVGKGSPLRKRFKMLMKNPDSSLPTHRTEPSEIEKQIAIVLAPF